MYDYKEDERDSYVYYFKHREKVAMTRVFSLAGGSGKQQVSLSPLAETHECRALLQ